MKKTNKKMITMLLAGALGVATLGAGLWKTDVAAADETTAAKTYSITEVFKSDASNVIGADNKGVAEAKDTVKFTLAQGESVEYRRNLALKWFDEVTVGEGATATKEVKPQYFNVKFSLTDSNFYQLSIVVESEAAQANEDNKAENKVTFKKDGDKIIVSVNGVDSAISVKANEIYTLTLSESKNANYGTFNVLLNGEVIGEFTNIGANYAKYESAKVIPFAVVSEEEPKEENGVASASDSSEESAEAESSEENSEGSVESDSEEDSSEITEEDAGKTVFYLHELNGQAFDEIETGTKKVADTAAPVVVINDDIIDGLLIGTAFPYYTPTVLDVLDTTSGDKLLTTREFYQWNPSDTLVSWNTKMKATLYFKPTTYYFAEESNETFYYATRDDAVNSGKEFKATTVYNQFDKEFISVKYTVKDASEKQQTYELAWYADETAKEEKAVGEFSQEYIYLISKNDGPTYKHIGLDDENAKNEIVNEKAYEEAVAGYQSALDCGDPDHADCSCAAKEATAGSNSYIYFPSLSGLIEDNSGYRNLKFRICYKSEKETSSKSSGLLSYNGLQLSTSNEGYYEFKVLATDAAGNAMQYYLDGELVTVTTSNIWDIEEIPTFHYTIKRDKLSILNSSDNVSKRKDDVELNGKFSGFSDPTIKGIQGTKVSSYALYKVDTSAYNGNKALTYDLMASITYAEIKTEIDKRFKIEIPSGDELFELYMEIYREKLAVKLSTTADALKDCFIRINEYDPAITEGDSGWEHNKFNWNASAKSFEAVEECEYIIFADYYDSKYQQQHIAAYKVIEVEAEAYVKYEKTQWLKNNITSVILFAIAGVMFVMIIVLLLIKPSDETLEDVDAAAAEKKNGKKKGK